MSKKILCRTVLVLTLCVALHGMFGNEATAATAYKKLSPAETRIMMQEKKGVTIVDVRSEGERQEKYIGGSINIPHIEIEQRAAVELPNKDATIFVYCVSGRRSSYAANKLVEMGYSQVYDLGAMSNWPYEVVVLEQEAQAPAVEPPPPSTNPAQEPAAQP